MKNAEKKTKNDAVKAPKAPGAIFGLFLCVFHQRRPFNPLSCLNVLSEFRDGKPKGKIRLGFPKGKIRRIFIAKGLSFANTQALATRMRFFADLLFCYADADFA